MTIMEKEGLWNTFATFLATHFGVDREKVRREASFTADLGADSLDMAELLLEIEDRYKITLSVKETPQFATIGEAFEYVVARIPAS